ncbi:MAG: Fic family protein [Parachlamydiaceae bacterium]|nr:Fic family protein [Parachlamydiaceae bacterium]
MTENKQVLLNLLKTQIDPIGIKELSQLLNLPERSIRRWIQEWVSDGIVIKSGHTKKSRYIFWKKEDNKFLYFSSSSQTVLKKLSLPLYERSPVSYNEDWFESYVANETSYFSLGICIKLAEAGLRSASNEPAGTYAHEIYNRLLIDLSYNSSRLEGNTYSLLETERLLLQGDAPEGKLDEEKVMLLNHKEAIRYLVNNAGRLNVSLDTVLTIHYLLADTLVDWKYAGKVRDHGVRIGGSAYIPLENQGYLQKQLKRIVEKAASIINPYEQSLFLLIHISYLQAFSAVNKRTARLCANISLIQKNLVPCSFNDIERGDYMSAMIAIYEFQEVAPIIDLYVYSYLRTCHAYDSTVKDVKFDSLRVLYRRQRREIEREVITRQLVGDSLLAYVDNSLMNSIPPADLNKVREDTIEDLNRMDSISIAGLGVTLEELLIWINKRTIL